MEEILEPDIEIFEKRVAHFITTDKEEHYNSHYKWCKVSGLSCSMGEYAMLSIESNGYISDDEEVMYPLNNVLSIEWELRERVKKISRYEDSYCIWFDNNKLNEMKDVN